MADAKQEAEEEELKAAELKSPRQWTANDYVQQKQQQRSPSGPPFVEYACKGGNLTRVDGTAQSLMPSSSTGSERAESPETLST